MSFIPNRIEDSMDNVYKRDYLYKSRNGESMNEHTNLYDQKGILEMTR